MFTLSDVLAGTGGRLVAGTETAAFRSVAIDSRTAGRGELFAAFRGQKHDATRFVMQAFGHGAAGALIEHLPDDELWASPEWDGPPVVLVGSTGQALQDLARYWRGKHDVKVVGVTGSVGKTSTKELIAGLLARHMSVLRTQANLNTEIGLPLTLMQLDSSHRVAVLEMGMHDLGEIRQLAHIAQPNIGVVTNVQPSHLQRLKSMERIAEAKSELVQSLPADGLAVLNFDDERVRAMAELTPAKTSYYGLSSEADVWADDIQSRGLRGIQFTTHHRGRQLRTHMNLLGAHSVHAGLAAAIVAMRLGISFDAAIGGLREVEQGLRLVVAQGIRGSTVLDDTYNANPASMLAAINLLAEMEGRRVAVLGDMLELGSYEEEGHRLVGRRAGAVVDWLLTVGPRARQIAEEARQMHRRTREVESFDDQTQLVERLQSGLRPGDFVLVKASHGVGLDKVVSAIREAA